jgi:hypothetical protein
VPLLTIDAAERVVIIMHDSYRLEVWIDSSAIYILEHGMITPNHDSTILDDSISTPRFSPTHHSNQEGCMTQTFHPMMVSVLCASWISTRRVHISACTDERLGHVVPERMRDW